MTNDSSTKKYVFDDVNVLIGHIKSKIDNLTPLKLQKSLYFLWAFYSATYGNIDYDSESEFKLQNEYPKLLFPAKFEAWKYGPVINDVYSEEKSGEISYLKDNYEPQNDNEKEILDFINDLLLQINSVDDFGLVARSHKDSAWRNAYNEGEYHCKMSNKEIKDDYVRYVSEQSAI